MASTIAIFKPLLESRATANSTPHLRHTSRVLKSIIGPLRGERPIPSCRSASHLTSMLSLELTTRPDDVRVDIFINETDTRLAKRIEQIQLAALKQEPGTLPTPAYTSSYLVRGPAEAPPALNVDIHVVGSRGDVQPFVALCRELKNKYCHRVPLATHGDVQEVRQGNRFGLLQYWWRSGRARCSQGGQQCAVKPGIILRCEESQLHR